MAFTIPIFQFVGILGSLWSIAVVLMSNHIGFTKTKYYYSAVFIADLVTNLSMLGFDKSLDFIINFNPDYILHTFNNNSVIMCKLTGYKIFKIKFKELRVFK